MHETMPSIKATDTPRSKWGLTSIARYLKIKASRRNKGKTYLAQQIRDYIDGSIKLFWHRQSMYLASGLLAGLYYDTYIAVICFAFCQMTEVFDYAVTAKIQKWTSDSIAKANHFLNLLSVSTVLSASAVSAFAILISQIEGPGLHFTALFFLFGASLFAAMNNHQLLRVLLVRLGIYGATFLYIPARDLWALAPPLSSFLWLQFFTCVFVLYLIIDCSVIFITKYRNGLSQMEELRMERDRAKAAYETKSQFVSIVSHELRTPLTSIKGGLSLIQSGNLGEIPKEFRKIFGIAHKNSNRLALLIDDLLDLQKLEAGQMRYRFATLELNDLIKESIDAIESYARSVDISFDFTGGLSPLYIKGDLDRLCQVMANILSNAVKFSPQGSSIKVWAQRVGTKARISVMDQGIGIPEGSHDLVFGTFSQVDSRDRRKIGGSGLGLSIAKQIVDGHKGTIEYASVEGEGTTFYVEIELCDLDPS